MDDQNQGDELYPIAVLIDELKVRARCIVAWVEYGGDGDVEH